MGDCGGYEARVKVKVKAKTNENGINCKEKELILERNDFSENEALKLFKKLKKDFLITNGSEEIIIPWKDKYENMTLEEIEDDYGDSVFTYFYNADVYVLNDIKVDKKQLQELNEDNPILENGYIDIDCGHTWNFIYCDSDNRSMTEITNRILKTIEICKNNNYEFNIFIEGDGNCNC
jgi:hypothetical protein